MYKALYKINSVLLTSLIVGFIAALLIPQKAYADECGGQYGDPCLINKSFSVVKRVKFEDEDDDDYRDKITDVKEGDEIVFRIRVYNNTDTDGVEGVSFDDMKMSDDFPSDDLVHLGNDGLTEYWDDFKPGDKKTFYIKAKVKDSEYDKTNYENCTVNRVEVSWDGKLEASDTAVVCYKTSEISELPSTGPTANLLMTILGLTSVTSGLGLKRLWA